MTGNERIPFESQFKTTEIFKRESAIRKNDILAFSETMNGYFNIVTNDAWQLWNKAKAETVPVWISADFMKPDEGNLVLGISTTKLAKFNVYQVVALDEFDECEINYWMPLPTAPSESGAEQ